MKDWFKYKYGFVNIDDENIYLTSTGNWSEALKLEEKGVQKSTQMRKIRIQIFMGVCVLLAIVMIFTGLIKGQGSLMLLVALPSGLFYTYTYLRTGLGPNYKVPINKIKAITIQENIALIEFNYLENNCWTEKLENMEEKGIDLLNDLITKKNLGKKDSGQ